MSDDTGVVIDIAPVEDALKQTNLNHKKIVKKVLSEVGKKQAKIFNRYIGQSTKKITGELKKAYTYKVKVTDFEEKVTMYARSKGKESIYPKLMTLNYGAHIKPVTCKTLIIHGDGWWARPISVNIQGRHFLEPAWQSYGAKGDFTEDAQKVIDKELDKFWG